MSSGAALRWRFSGDMEEWAMLDFLPAIDTGLIAWIVMWTLLVVGVLGTLLPFLPGPLLIFLGAVVHWVWVPASELGTAVMITLAVLVLLAYLVDFLASAAGARWFGSSRWGILGVLVGGIVGIFFGLPGLLLGPLVGGFAFEMGFARKNLHGATRSTWGAVVGTVAGLAIKIGIAVVMAVLMLVDLFFLLVEQ